MLVLFVTLFLIIWVFVIVNYWIYEHFPSNCDKWVITAIIGSHWPRDGGKACIPKRCYGVHKEDYELTVGDVIWTPYTGHVVDKGDKEFDDAILFSSYLRWDELMARHLPERCMH